MWIGEALFQSPICLFEKAVRLEPNQAHHHLNCAIAPKATRQTAKSRQSNKRARALDRSLALPP